MGDNKGLQFWAADIVTSKAAAALRDPAALVNPYEDNKVFLTAFVSCYNESRYIINTLNTVVSALREARAGAMTYEILVIDDCSKDDSVEVVRRFINEHPGEPITLRANKKNKGWAQNCIDAAFLGCGKYFRPICGDNSESKETMVAVFDAIGQADIIVPYYTQNIGRSISRKIVSRGYTFVINLITGYRLRYYNGLAVNLRYNIMRWHSNSHGFGFQADILCLLLDMGFTYKEVPVYTTQNRLEPSNALTVRNILSVLHSISEIFLRRLSHRLYRR